MSDEPLPPDWQAWDERRQKKERGPWAWHADELLIATAEFCADPPPVPIASVPLWLRNYPQVAGRSLDEAIERFSESRRWPPLSVENRYVLRLRSMYAQEIIRGHRRSRQPAPEATWGEIFRWLLIDCWHARRGEWAEDSRD